MTQWLILTLFLPALKALDAESSSSPPRSRHSGTPSLRRRSSQHKYNDDVPLGLDDRGDVREGGVELRGIFAAGLREIGAAAAGAADNRRYSFDDVAGLYLRAEVRRHCDDQRDLIAEVRADHRDT